MRNETTTTIGVGSPVSSESDSKHENLEIDETSSISSISVKGGSIDFSDLPSAIEIHPQNANLTGTPGNTQQFIKRPLNAYMIWTVEQRQKIQKEPRQKMNEVSRAMGEVWKKMSAEEKAPYFAQAKKYADEHKRALKENPNLAYVPSKKKMKLSKDNKDETFSMPSSPDLPDIPDSPAPSMKSISYIPSSSPMISRTPTTIYSTSPTKQFIQTYNNDLTRNLPTTTTQIFMQQTLPEHSQIYPQQTTTYIQTNSRPIQPNIPQNSSNQQQQSEQFQTNLNPSQIVDRYYTSLCQFNFTCPYESPMKLKDPNYYYDLLMQSTRH